MTWSILSKEYNLTLSGTGASSAVFFSSCSDDVADTLAAAPFTLLSKSKNSSAPSSLFNVSGRGKSFSPADVNFEKRVSNSSGSSTFVIISTIVSAEVGIASIINGISSASKPKSNDACCIISRNKDLAFSVPYASSLSFKWRAAKSACVNVQRIWLSLIFSIFI